MKGELFMKTTRILEEEDVKKIIAEKFGVEPKYVEVKIYKVSKGYGMDEHDEPKLEIVVTE